tara:strand:- start:2282 stop:2992 length:711 start_codon:yes stop_codon:yes gene_type:complete
MKLIILAAGKGSRIFKDINKNKCLVKINNQTIIEKIINDAIGCGIKNVEVVLGYRSRFVVKVIKKYKGVSFVMNKKYNSTDMVYSSMLALKKTNTDTIICYSDIIFHKLIFKKLISLNYKNITIPYITNWKNIWKKRNKSIFKDAETFKIKGNKLIEIGNKITTQNLKSVKGQFMGIIYLPRKKIGKLISQYKKVSNKIQYTSFINSLIKIKIPIQIIKHKNYWYEFDDIDDLKNF